MTRILLPIDGSPVSRRVADALLARIDAGLTAPEIHLINIQRPVSQDVGQFVNHEALRDFHRDEGLKALAEARAVLEAAGLAPVPHVVVDDQPAAAIVRFAGEQAVDEIVMGSHGRGAVAAMLLGSVAREVSRLAGIPVTLVK
ncbi:universal stress protein [Zoogloea sp. 1C4]|uniref:universal stress protein n=1 Tax=Zoogloea sp. 1C4 TaxID=2570190 RepID=UPI001290E6F6|nr:universal stress protein [Zoogloea sp. 1C4]